MGDAAQRVLMNEFKQLSKEKWTNIEVRFCEHRKCRHSSGEQEHPVNPPCRR
jgi:hypothetical protein